VQTSDRSGIICDQCGTVYTNDFLYYSFDFHQVSVYENRRPAIRQILAAKAISSLDICTQCFDIIKRKIVENYAKTMTADTRQRGKSQTGVVCELTGDRFAGTFDYYYCNVVKVEVRMSIRPNICAKCRAQTFDDKPCGKCGGTDFVRPADTKIDNRYVEINLGEQAFREIVNRAESTRKVAREWTTKT
jgi:hypothetical protein